MDPNTFKELEQGKLKIILHASLAIPLAFLAFGFQGIEKGAELAPFYVWFALALPCSLLGYAGWYFADVGWHYEEYCRSEALRLATDWAKFAKCNLRIAMGAILGSFAFSFIGVSQAISLWLLCLGVPVLLIGVWQCWQFLKLLR